MMLTMLLLFSCNHDCYQKEHGSDEGAAEMDKQEWEEEEGEEEEDHGDDEGDGASGGGNSGADDYRGGNLVMTHGGYPDAR